MMLYGFSDLQLAELYAPYNYALKGVNEFYMEYENDMYNFCYIKGKILCEGVGCCLGKVIKSLIWQR